MSGMAARITQLLAERRALVARLERAETDRDEWRSALKSLSFVDVPDDPKGAADAVAEYIAGLCINTNPEREVVGWTVRVTRGRPNEPWRLYPQRDEPSCLGPHVLGLDRKMAHVWSSKGDAQRYCHTWGEGTPVRIVRRKKSRGGVVDAIDDVLGQCDAERPVHGDLVSRARTELTELRRVRDAVREWGVQVRTCREATRRAQQDAKARGEWNWHDHQADPMPAHLAEQAVRSIADQLAVADQLANRESEQ